MTDPLSVAQRRTLSLTANDVALAFFGVAHMIHFWKQQHKSDYTRKELAKCEALATKLNAISDHLAPPRDAESGAYYTDEDGEQIIMRPVEEPHD